ncbi:MAG: WbqC family protein [Chloroherpetonaceae bacterium]|nr:WbqC family protein [Chthonomonadaceae bacterium]MDW8208921.1 WbqC family protein [Chloroherpetonaceae bacterium]
MTRVAVLQSNYLPWKGYFDIIHDVELFVFYDDVQYTRNDWRNRNRIKTPSGPLWLTVPVGTALDRRICDVTLPPDPRWAEKHWKTLRQYYGKAPYFALYADLLRHVYLECAWATLSELNQYLIRTISRDLLGISTNFADSREYALTGRRQERLLQLLQAVGATEYLSGPAARSYIDPEAFAQAGIHLRYKDYAGYPEYPQFHPPFDHHVTILDLLFHTGPQAPYYIWGWREEGRSGD